MVDALATMAASALVQAMVTDGWEAIRHKVARLFGRGQPDSAIERRLDASTDLLARSQPRELEEMRAQLAAQWGTRFADFLADHPDAAGELEELVREIEVSTAAASDHSLAARDIDMRADRGGVNVNAGSFKGSVITGPTRPGPVSS